MSSELVLALVGLPYSGKTIVFNILANIRQDGNQSLPTIKPRTALIDIHDLRLEQIADIIHPVKIFPLRIEIIDTPGIVVETPESHNTNLESFDSIRRADILGHVIGIISINNSPPDSILSNFQESIDKVGVEFINADKEIVERELERSNKDRKTPRQQTEQRILILNNLLTYLQAGKSLRDSLWDNESSDLISELRLISNKPQFFIVNYNETDIEVFNPTSIIDRMLGQVDIVVLCGQLEYEITQIDEIERTEFLEMYPQLVLRAASVPWLAFKANKMQTYFTFGPLGLKQWALPHGATAQDAAKRLHTDLAKNLVATEVYNNTDLIKLSSVEEIKRQGKLRVEGREYKIQDGDILYFRVSK